MGRRSPHTAVPPCCGPCEQFSATASNSTMFWRFCGASTWCTADKSPQRQPASCCGPCEQISAGRAQHHAGDLRRVGRCTGRAITAAAAAVNPGLNGACEQTGELPSLARGSYPEQPPALRADRRLAHDATPARVRSPKPGGETITARRSQCIPGEAGDPGPGNRASKSSRWDDGAWARAMGYHVRATVSLAERRQMTDPVWNSGDDPLLRAIVALVEGPEGAWSGTASELLDVVEAMVPAKKRRENWPASPNALGRHLTRLAPELEATGISLSRAEEGHANRRIIRLEVASEGTIPELECAGGTVLLPSPVSNERRWHLGRRCACRSLWPISRLVVTSAN
jgi:hypothetical protein